MRILARTILLVVSAALVSASASVARAPAIAHRPTPSESAMVSASAQAPSVRTLANRLGRLQNRMLSSIAEVPGTSATAADPRSIAPNQAIMGNTWWPIGPAPLREGQAWPYGRAPMSGRVNSVAVNPNDPTDAWIGTATGGVWRRVIDVEGRNDWEPMSDRQKSLAIGVVQLDDCDDTHCETVWAGTGENSIRRDTYYGVGLLRGRPFEPVPAFASLLAPVGKASTSPSALHEGDIQWTLLGEEEFTNGSINSMALDYTTTDDNKTLYVALSSGVTSNATHSTVTAPKPQFGYGIFKSTNTGADWDRLDIDGTTNDDIPTDLEIDPVDPSVLYAAFQGKGVFRSTNGGADWEPINVGLESVIATGDWPELAIFRETLADDAVMYAIIGDCPPPHPTDATGLSCDPGVYRSTDGGATWQERKPPNDGTFISYTMYTHALAIHPDDVETLVYGGVKLYRSDDGGETWDDIGTNVVHPDHHQVVFAPSNPDVLYNVNDGGVWISDNGGDNWEWLNRGLQITQVQSVSISPHTEAIIIGTQDNGTNLFTGSRIWSHIDDGDSASTVMDADTLAKLYDVYIRLEPRRCIAFGPDKEPDDICSQDWPTITNGISEESDSKVAWYPPIEEDPNASAVDSEGQPQHPIYFGTVRLYRTTTDGDSWQAVSRDLGSNTFHPEIQSFDAITAIAIAPSNSDRIYISYYDGGIWRTDAAGTDPGDWTAAGGPLNRVPTSLAVDPDDEDTVYVTYSEWGIAHVYRSTNGGDTWTPIHDDLPDIPANVVAIEQGPPKRLWLGTDAGIFVRPADLSEPWQRHGQGFDAQVTLPNVAVYDLAIDEARGRIYAGTHGRGVWVLTQPFIDNFEGWVDGSIWDIPVFGNGFLPADSCTMSVILESGATCWEGSQDTEGGSIHVDDMGRLVTSNMGEWNDKQVVWACRSGTCIGGLDIDQCMNPANDPSVDRISSIRVNCNGQEAFHQIRGCPALDNPPSSPLSIDLEASPGAAQDGFFQLFPTLQLGMPSPEHGETRALCSVSVPFAEGETNHEIMARAVEAIDSNAICTANGVGGVLKGMPPADVPLTEDQPSPPTQVFLHAPELAGSYLFPSVRTRPGEATGGCFNFDRLGIPLLHSLAILRLDFETAADGAAGGEITITEKSALGVCEIPISTSPGESALDITQNFEELFIAPGIPSPTPGCRNAENPRDVSRVEDSLIFVAAQSLTVCVDDPGVGFALMPEEVSVADLDDKYELLRSLEDLLHSFEQLLAAQPYQDPQLLKSYENLVHDFERLLRQRQAEQGVLEKELLLSFECLLHGFENLLDRYFGLQPMPLPAYCPMREPEGQADLVPVPPFPPASTPSQLPQNFCARPEQGKVARVLRVIVRNQGVAAAGPSTTQVDFFEAGIVSLATPALEPGEETIRELAIPRNCYRGESGCEFKIEVDSNQAITESQETNNVEQSFCPGVAS